MPFFDDMLNPLLKYYLFLPREVSSKIYCMSRPGNHPNPKKDQAISTLNCRTCLRVQLKWKENNAENMLALRIVRENDEWDECWENTKAA